MTTPLERFDAWVKDNPETIMELAKIACQDPHYFPNTHQWAKRQVVKKRLWLATHPEKASRRRNWKRSLGNWFKLAVNKNLDPPKPRPYVGYMTYEEEQIYYRRQRQARPVQEDLESIRDIIKKMPEVK